MGCTLKDSFIIVIIGRDTESSIAIKNQNNKIYKVKYHPAEIRQGDIPYVLKISQYSAIMYL